MNQPTFYSSTIKFEFEHFFFFSLLFSEENDAASSVSLIGISNGNKMSVKPNTTHFTICANVQYAYIVGMETKGWTGIF